MFRCKLLGGAVVYDASGPLTGRAAQRRRLALLALLAGSSSRGISRERAAAYFWPDHEPSQGRRRLSDTLYVLRSELGDEAIVSSGDRLLLNPDIIATDVAALEEAMASGDAERAVEVYGGPFLDGFQLDGAPAFMHWAEAERERLARRYKQVLRQAAETLASQGHYRAAVHRWRQLTAHDPYDSQGALGLMRALEAVGNRPLALRHAQEHAAVLRRDLDVAPDPAVTAFAEHLRDSVGTSSGKKQRRIPGQVPPPLPETAPDADTSTSSQDAAGGQAKEGAMADHSPASGTQGRRIYWMIGAASLLLLLVTVLTLSPTFGNLFSSSGPPRTLADVVVVLPFKNETGDASLQVIRGMTADWITRGLNRAGLVDVIDARLELGGVDTTWLQQRGSARDLARRLGAGMLVWGRYYRVRDSLYFQAQIVDVVSGKLLRAGTLIGGPVEEPLESLEHLRKSVMVSLSALLNPQLADWARTSYRLPSYAAYRAFIEAQETWLSSGPTQAREGFRRAVALDSTFVLARAYLAKATGYAGHWAKADSLLRQLTTARRRLSPLMQAELHRMAAFCRGEPRELLEATRRMVELAPHSTYAAWSAADAEMMNGHPRRALEYLHGLKTEDAALVGRAQYWSLLAYVHHVLGDYREALHVARQARRQFPRDVQIRAEEIRALAALGRVEAVQQRLADAATAPDVFEKEAALVKLTILAGRELFVHRHPEGANAVYAQTLHRVYSVDGNNTMLISGSRSEQAQAAYGRLLYRAGRQEAAHRVFATLAAKYPDRVDYVGMLGVTAAALGDASEAQAVDQRLARWPGTYLAGEHLHYRACIAALLGAESKAVALLRRAVDQGLGRGHPYQFTPHNEPDLLPLGRLRHIPFEMLSEEEHVGVEVECREGVARAG